jgi:hypothetical protein
MDRPRRIVLAAILAAGLPIACRSILGIEERELDPALVDGGQDGASDPLSCEAYCAAVAVACTGENLQYRSTAACLGLCQTWPVGTLADTTGDTLGCRINQTTVAGNTGERSDCAGAGPGGNGICGTNCASFCASLAIVCPTDYDGSAADCMTDCGRLPSCGDYHVDPAQDPDDDTVQCRLFHLTSATQSATTHCPHAMGLIKCIPPDGGSATCPDAGP